MDGEAGDQQGFAHDVFSNEAGLGPAPMVYATAEIEHPVQQGLYGIFEIFVDAFVICSITALVILTTCPLTKLVKKFDEKKREGKYQNSIL